MKGFNLALQPGRKFVNKALVSEYYHAWHEREACSYSGFGGYSHDIDFTQPENWTHRNRFLRHWFPHVWGMIDYYSQPNYGEYTTGDIFQDVPGKTAENIDPAGIAKHLSPAACRMCLTSAFYLRDGETSGTDQRYFYQPYFQVPALLYADVDFDDTVAYGVIKDRQSTVEILSGTDARCQSYTILYHDKTHLHLDKQALDDWPFSNDVVVRLHTLSTEGEPMTVQLSNVELVSFGILRPNDTQLYIESIDQYNSWYEKPYNPKVTPGYYHFVSHSHRHYYGSLSATLVFDSNLAQCNYYNEDSWAPRAFYIRISVNGISYPDPNWAATHWFRVYYQLDQKINHTRLNPRFWTDTYGWTSNAYAQGGSFLNARRINIYRDITAYCLWPAYQLDQNRNTPLEQTRRGMLSKYGGTGGTCLERLQQLDQALTPWTVGSDTYHCQIGAWGTCSGGGYGYCSFISRGGCSRWDEETESFIYCDGQYNGDAPVIGVGFWGSTQYSAYGPTFQKPTHPLQTDLFYGYSPIETLTAEQVASYGTYLDTMSYDQHIADYNDAQEGMYYQQPIQWWTFPNDHINNGIIPFFRWAPNHPCLAENYVADVDQYNLLFTLYSNWSGFLKRDFQYVADRTDDWLA